MSSYWNNYRDDQSVPLQDFAPTAGGWQTAPAHPGDATQDAQPRSDSLPAYMSMPQAPFRPFSPATDAFSIPADQAETVDAQPFASLHPFLPPARPHQQAPQYAAASRPASYPHANAQAYASAFDARMTRPASYAPGAGYHATDAWSAPFSAGSGPMLTAPTSLAPAVGPHTRPSFVSHNSDSGIPTPMPSFGSGASGAPLVPPTDAADLALSPQPSHADTSGAAKKSSRRKWIVGLGLVALAAAGGGAAAGVILSRQHGSSSSSTSSSTAAATAALTGASLGLSTHSSTHTVWSSVASTTATPSAAQTATPTAAPSTTYVDPTTQVQASSSTDGGGEISSSSSSSSSTAPSTAPTTAPTSPGQGAASDPTAPVAGGNSTAPGAGDTTPTPNNNTTAAPNPYWKTITFTEANGVVTTLTHHDHGPVVLPSSAARA